MTRTQRWPRRPVLLPSSPTYALIGAFGTLLVVLLILAFAAFVALAGAL